ncbi:unnamed protein product, partial [Brachionus calyciflorus]
KGKGDLDLSRGFGDGINWMTLKSTAEAEEKKPFFILIHKTWCGACQNLKESLRDSIKFKELSELFHMINLEDEEEPEDDGYAPDGKYIPRLLFLDNSGHLNEDLINENGNPKYKYFYSNADQVFCLPVILSMEKAIEKFYEDDEDDLNGFGDGEENLDYGEYTDENLLDELSKTNETENVENVSHDEF